MEAFNPIPLARSSDPVTSHQAAEKAGGLQAKHQGSILDTLRSYGPLGKSSIAVYGWMSEVAVCRRLPELERKGLIEQTGRTVKSSAGRAEREWRVIGQ
jgi:hypothetical protein